MERHFSSVEVCAAADISYRQLDYWCRLGVITPDRDCFGSGTRRRFSLQNIAVIRVLAALRPYVKDLTALQEVAGLLDEWPFAEWGSGLVIDDRGHAWLPGEQGAPALGIHVDLTRWKIPEVMAAAT